MGPSFWFLAITGSWAAELLYGDQEEEGWQGWLSVTAKAVHGGPCPYNRRPPHGHDYVRGVCHRCGNRDEQTVDETEWRQLDAARKEFRKAAQVLDEQMATTPLGAPEMLNTVVRFRMRIEHLRLAEAAWEQKYPRT